MEKQKIKKQILIFTIMICFVVLCFFHSLINPFIIDLMADRFKVVEVNNNLIVHAINVGQADAFAINLPDGKIVLIDCGSKETNVDYIEYLKANVVNSKTKCVIDYLILSHADSDHIGGTMKLFKNFQINTVFMPKIMSNTQTFEEIYNYVTKYCNYQITGEDFSIKNEMFKIRFFEQLNNSNTNDASQLIKLDCYNKSFLFTGDMSANMEDDYVRKYGSELDCDVLKVSHHGAKSATSQLFLDCVTPEIAVLSVGANNDYNHPNDEIIERLNYNNIKIYRTDVNGNIIFVNGEDYNLKVLTGNYYITRLSLDYRVYILISEVFLAVLVIIISIDEDCKKRKKKFEW